MLQFSHRNRKLWRLALLLGAVVLFVIVLPRDNPRTESLSRPPGPRKSRLAFLGPWSGPLHSTWLRLKFRFFGPLRSIGIHSQIFEINEPLVLDDFPRSRSVLSNETGVQVWLLDAKQTALLRKHSQDSGAVVSSPSITTADGVPARMSMGQNVFAQGMTLFEGIEFDCLPRLRGPMLDLSSFVMMTQVITNPPALPGEAGQIMVRTNIAAGARVQIPSGHSMFLRTATGANGKKMGVIVTPKI